MKELLSKEENCSILTKHNHYQTMSPIFLLSVAGATVLGSYCLYHFLKKYYPHSLQHLNTLGAIVYKIPSLVCWAGISLYYYLGNTNSQPNRSKNSKPKLDTQEEFQAHIKQRKLENQEFQAREAESQANKEQYQANERRFQAMMEEFRSYMEESKTRQDNQFAEIIQNLLDPQSRPHIAQTLQNLDPQSRTHIAQTLQNLAPQRRRPYIAEILQHLSDLQSRTHTERVEQSRVGQTIEASAPPTP